jgi:hypothetical protein
MQVTTVQKDRKLAVIAFAVLLVISYAGLSADCSTGGSCTLANGAWFNWIATTIPH